MSSVPESFAPVPTSPGAPLRFDRGRVGRLFAFLTGLLLIAIAIHALHLVMNTTSSMPVGIYNVESLTKPVTAGDIVVVCPPLEAAVLARERGYLVRGSCAGGVVAMIKIVLATAGAWVDVEPHGLSVNGVRVSKSATTDRDTSMRPLNHVTFGRHRIPVGYIWLWSPHPNSWDSRYYGMVPVKNVRGTASLVLPLGPWPYAVTTVRG